MRIQPSYEFTGPLGSNLRVQIGHKILTEAILNSKDKIQEAIDNAIYYMDLPIEETFEIDVNDFPKQVQVQLAQLLKHPKIKVI